ncbi:MAG: carboxypeptidase M32 [Clostridiales bacterium]|jgi:carboxypeptidase Taq|nr:carboxypeptidase M32 [Clostridiales bacterium]
MASEFMAYLDKSKAIGNALALIHWDMSTGAPPGGIPARAKTFGILAEEQFTLAVSGKMQEFLQAPQEGLDELERVSMRESQKFYDSWKNIPPEDIGKYNELLGNSQSVWEKAKAESDFASFAPALEQIIQWQRRFATLRGVSGNPYDALLDDYESGMTTEKLDAFFSQLKKTIVPLVQEISEKGKKFDASFAKRPVPAETQKKISKLLMDRLGFDFKCGMIRESVHPFTTNFSKGDVRITTNYHENDFLSSFYSVLHETGHALYEQNIGDEVAETILGKGASMSIHESQSRFYENVIGRSREFWESVYGSVIALLGKEFSDVTAEDLYFASNQAKPSLIRIESDELTYSLHIMVRYEMEKEIIINGRPVAELPALWNEKMREYLGLTPPDDAHGILQDVHWSQGSFGYFPSYALGNAYAAQFLHFMKKDIPVFELVKKGDLKPITQWLTSKIHMHGALKTPEEIVVGATGEPLDASYFTNYLESKFRAICLQ